MTRRQFAGGAARTLLVGSIASSGGGTVTIASATGWPDGSIGKFYVVVDPGTSAEEKILCDFLVGTTITYSAVGRGADGTVATSHSAGASIWHCITAVDLDEANAHINAAAASHTAAQVTFAPTGNIAATTVQAAIAEVDSENDTRLDAHDTTLTAIQAANWVDNTRMADSSVGGLEMMTAKYTRTTVVSITNSAYTPIVWEAEASDPDSLASFSTSTITIAKEGLYILGGTFTWASAIGALGIVVLALNSSAWASTTAGADGGFNIAAPADGLSTRWSTTMYFKASDTFVLQLRLASGGPINASAFTTHLTRISA